MAPFGFPGYNGSVKGVVALAAALAGVAAASAGAATKPHVETARSGGVEAVLTYRYDATRVRFTNQRLTIKRAGVTRFSAALRRPPDGGFDAQPARYFAHKRSVSISDLEADGEPEVLLDLYWGGAHCCWYTQIYRWSADAQTYLPLVHVWGNFSYVLADLDHDGRQELVTRDNRFSYAFGSFADSRWPVRILRYRGGRVSVVTTTYRDEIGRDANALWHAAMSRPRKLSNQGIVAAWAGDEALVGHWRIALKRIDRFARSGRIHGPLPRARFEARLRAFLRRTGYV